MSITFYLGGARSGKSNMAEQCAKNTKKPVHYIATAENKDPEMSNRIIHHKHNRPKEWTLSESPLLLTKAIETHANKDNCVLVDCLTLWISNWLCSNQPEKWQAQKQSLLDVLHKKAKMDCDIILVSNEVGHGIVPMGELSRQFVDESGWLHQDIAAMADNVNFVMAGLVVPLKTQLPQSAQS